MTHADLIDTAAEREKLATLAGFTPGPWRQGQNNPDRVSRDGEYIANCNPTHQTHPRTESNARLIAAAPDLLATIHRLLDALDTEARAAAAAAYERAADACADYPRVAPDATEWPHYDDQIAHSQACIRALATEAETTALAEMLDAETQACAEICDINDQVSGWVSRDAILARIDQRKEAVE